MTDPVSFLFGLAIGLGSRSTPPDPVAPCNPCPPMTTTDLYVLALCALFLVAIVVMVWPRR